MTAEYVTVFEAALLVGFCAKHDSDNAQDAATRRLKREIDSAEKTVREARDGDCWTPPMHPMLRQRIEDGESILRGLRGPGGVLHVNLGELRQLCPHLFPVQWHPQAVELRQHLAATNRRLDQLEAEDAQQAEAAFALYLEESEKLEALACALALTMPSCHARKLFSPPDGHKRTQADDSDALGERETFSLARQGSTTHIPGDKDGNANADTDTAAE